MHSLPSMGQYLYYKSNRNHWEVGSVGSVVCILVLEILDLGCAEPRGSCFVAYKTRRAGMVEMVLPPSPLEDSQRY